MNKSVVDHATKSLVIIGDNFIAQSLYNDYKRYGKFRINISKDITHVKNKVDYIIDSSFNERTQNLSLSYCRLNNVDKILLVNHWERKKLPDIKTPILQSVLYDVYGTEHNSFDRQGAGNNYDTEINYCTLIAESLRRIHEAKINGLPLVYIPYGENKVKCSHIDNIYEPINFMLTKLKETSVYAVFDEDKYVSAIINSIQKVIEYQGRIIIKNNNSIYTQHVKSLDFKSKHHHFEGSIRRIYKYLRLNNNRFSIYLDY